MFNQNLRAIFFLKIQKFVSYHQSVFKIEKRTEKTMNISVNPVSRVDFKNI